MAKDKNKNSLATVTKSSIWGLQENDILRLWDEAKEESEFAENMNRYLSVIRTAFEIEDIKIDKPEIIAKYEARGMQVGVMVNAKGEEQKVGIKKRPILRVTDLTYENIRTISAAKLLEVIDRNFGGGWDSLSQSIKDIIESGFDITTTSLPKDRLHKAGGLYENKVNDGFDVLEIPKGTWVEAIFAKVKPAAIKPKSMFSDEDGKLDLDDMEDDDDMDLKDDYYDNDEDDDNYDEDMLTEESYRTAIEENPEDLEMEAEAMGEDEYDE